MLFKKVVYFEAKPLKLKLQFLLENLGVNLNFVRPVYSGNKKVSNGGQFKS